MTQWLYLCSDLGIPLDGNKGASEHVRAVTRALCNAGVAVSVLAARGRLPDGHPATQIDPGFGGDARRLADALRRWLGGMDENDALAGEAAQMAYESSLAEWISEGRLAQRVEVVVERLSLFGSCGRQAAAKFGATFLVEMNAPIADEAAAYRDASLVRLAQRIEERTLASADVIMTVSEELRDDVIRRNGLDGERVVCVPNGVDLELFSRQTDRAALRAKAGVPVDCLLFGFVGSLKAWHGVDIMLDAFARARPMLPGAHLLVVGDTRRTGAYRKLAERLKIGECVTFYGEADHSTAAALLSAMDVGLAPYLPQESFYFSPLKLNEYMAAGLCVIASRAGQITRVIRDNVNGLLCSPGDVESLVNCMLTAGRDKALRLRLGNAARLDVQQNDWNQVARRIVELAVNARSRKTVGLRESAYVA